MELNDLDQWLVDTLDDATLLAAAPGGVHSEQAPEGTEEPFVVFQSIAPRDINAIGGNRVMVDALYDIKVVAEGESYLALGPAADRIDALIHGAASGAVISCIRVAPIRYAEKVRGANYRHLGGSYRFQVS